MALDRPELQEIIDRIEADIETRTGTGILRRSVLRVLARVLAGAIHSLYGYLDYQSDQIFVNSADTDGLDRHAEEYGLSRYDAKKATGNIGLVGSYGTVVPAGTIVQTADGLQYTVMEEAELTIATGLPSPFDYVAYMDVEARFSGAIYNQDAGTVVTVIVTIPGLYGQGEITEGDDGEGVTGGTDTETDDELRQRLIHRKQYPPMGGAEEDYVTWMLEYAAVTRAWCFPGYSGSGTVGCAFVEDNNTDLLPTSDERDAVKEYIISHTDPASGLTVGCPVAARSGLTMIELSKLEVNFEIVLVPNTTDVQEQVTLELDDLIKREGGPGETLRHSRIIEAISAAYGEIRHILVSPTTDIAAANNQVHVLGTIVFTGE